MDYPPFDGARFGNLGDLKVSELVRQKEAAIRDLNDIGGLKGDREALLVDRVELRKDFEDPGREIPETTEEVDAEGRLSRALSDRRLVRRNLVSAANSNRALVRRHETLTEQIDTLAARARELASELEWIRASSSWQITAPLRALKLTVLRFAKLTGEISAACGLVRRAFQRNSIPAGAPLPDETESIGQSPSASHSELASLSEYELWTRRFDTITGDDISDICEVILNLSPPPLLLLCDLTELPEQSAALAVRSLRSQIYENWRAVLIYDAECLEARSTIIAACFADPRISVTQSRGPTPLLRFDECLVVADGVLFRPHSLALLACAAAAGANLVYGDHDLISMPGRRREPFFKPDFSPLLLSQLDYLGALLLFRLQGESRECRVLGYSFAARDVRS